MREQTLINHNSSEEFQNLTAKIILSDCPLQLFYFMDEKLRPREGKKIAQHTQPLSHTTELEARLQMPSTKLFSLHLLFMI